MPRISKEEALKHARSINPPPAWEGDPWLIPEYTGPCDWMGSVVKPPPGGNPLSTWTRCEHPARPLGEVACPCKGCGNLCGGYTTCQTSFPAPVRRHLVYHILPVSGPVWRRGVDQLRLRWNLFTGMKVIGIATGGPVMAHKGDGKQYPLESAKKVREYLPPDCEVIEYENAPNRWELSGWPKLWRRLFEGCQDDDAVLYAHAKGVTRPGHQTVHAWADEMYRLNLDYWDVVEELLKNHPVAGAFKRAGSTLARACKDTPGMENSHWYFAGNFWWSRCGPLREKMAAVPVPPDPWGAEAWAGLAWGWQEAGSVWTHVGTNRHYYGKPDWDLTQSEIDAWRARNPPRPVPDRIPLPVVHVDRPGAVTFSVLVPTIGKRLSLSRALDSITSQLVPGDELLLRVDDSHDAGATPRNLMMPRASGSWLLFMDDDDIYLPGALATVRKVLEKSRRVPHVFRMRRGAPFNDVVPADGVRTLRVGQVSTQCIIVPNDPERLGEWGRRYANDWDFVFSTISKYPPGSLVMRPEIISHWRPPT